MEVKEKMTTGRIGYALGETARDMTIRPYQYVAKTIDESDAGPGAKAAAKTAGYIAIAGAEAFLGIRSFGIIPAVVAAGRFRTHYKEYGLKQ